MTDPTALVQMPIAVFGHYLRPIMEVKTDEEVTTVPMTTLIPTLTSQLKIVRALLMEQVLLAEVYYPLQPAELIREILMTIRIQQIPNQLRNLFPVYVVK